MSHALLADFDRIIRRDPARRGLIGSESQFGPLCPGHLAAAAVDLAESARSVAIVTGFYVPRATPPAAETDGPPGAVLLAASLAGIGIEAHVVTDDWCASAVRAMARAFPYPQERVLVYPHGSSDWRDEFFTTGPGARLTHLVSIERVGPSHTCESLAAQFRTLPAPLDDFRARVLADGHDRCHNMRGDAIDPHTADLHRLFEELHRHRPSARTIGIGDGANEIGMGAVPWEDLVRRLAGEHAPRIPCRIATHWNIIAGTSNWGAAALAAGVLALRGETQVLAGWDREHQRRALERMVAEGPAVDGATALQEATVDGLPFLTYIQPWESIRRLLGLEETAQAVGSRQSAVGSRQKAQSHRDRRLTIDRMQP
ncbi:MAG: glutamate cyclase domain-containing protein [Planctomycetales bacterium]